MKLKTGNPRVRGPRKTGRSSNAHASRRQNVEPSTFAWTEPLGDAAPIVVDHEVVVEREVIVEREVEKQIFVDRPVEVERKVFVDREVTVERQVFVEKPVLVDKPVVVEKIVEKQVFVDRPVEVEKKVFVDRFVDRIVEVGAKRDPTKEAAAVGVVAAATAKAEGKSKQSKAQQQPKAIIIGRGPSMATKIGRVAPKPTPVLAGVTALLIAIGGVALISPTSENADAARAGAAFTSVEASGKTAPADIGSMTNKTSRQAQSRDPFAAKAYKPPVKQAASTNPKAAVAANGKGKAAATPTVATPSLFAAKFTTYSSFTPWTNSTKRSGNWINFGGKPTVKVVSVGKSGVDLFVVTDVEMIAEKSKNFKYDKPLRQVHLGKDGVVRFADYRDIQGDDVMYTIRFGGSKLIKVPTKN